MLDIFLCILLNVLAAAHIALADPCTEIDLSKEGFNPPQLPVRNQGDIGWCYANAAADLVTWRYSKNQMISAADMALGYNLYQNRHSNTDGFELQGGLVNQTINAVSGRDLFFGACSESDFHMPNDFAVSPNGNLKITYKIDVLRNTLASFQTIISDEPLDQQTIDMLHLASAMISDFKAIFPNITAEQIIRAFHASKRLRTTNASLNFVFALRAQVCTNRIQLAPRPIMFSDGFDDRFFFSEALDLKRSQLLRELESALDKHIPVAISYHEHFLVKESQLLANQGRHASVIIGKKADSSGACMYLLRNSWGTNCKQYDPIVQSRCLEDSGYIWLTHEELYRSIFGINYISN